MSNYDTMDLIYQYYDARMTSEYLDNEGEGWSDGVVQTCLPELLYNIQPVKDHPGSGYVQPIDAQR